MMTNTNTNTNSIQSALNALKAFRSAFQSLTEAWNDPTVAEILNDVPCYPFGKSFDDMALDADTWTMIAESDLTCKLATDAVYNSLKQHPLTSGEMVAVLDAVRQMIETDYPGELS